MNKFQNNCTLLEGMMVKTGAKKAWSTVAGWFN
jgi:hypothetical protein